jgi:hypothetical protein
MRTLGRLLVVLVLIGFAAAGVHVAWRSLADAFVVEERAEAPRVPSPAYALDSERWTRFPFSAPARQVRLVTNADVPPDALEEAESWRYGVQYRIADIRGRALREGVLHLTAQLPHFGDPQTGDAVPAAIYAAGSDLPTSSRVSLLDIGGETGAHEIQLRAAGLEDGVRGVSARVYERRPFREGRTEVAWQRLSPGDRERLARASVYPAALLGIQERARLLRNAWFPVGPSGVEGVDYRLRTLLTLGETFEGERLLPDQEPSGLPIDRERRLTVQLPEAGGRVRVEIHRREPGPVALDIGWFGRGIEARDMRRYRLGSEDHLVEDAFEGGLIELSAEAPVNVRVLLLGQEAAERDLTAEVGRMRLYELGGGLSFPVPALASGDAAFRLALRCACFDTEGRLLAGAPAIEYAVIGTDGAAMGRGEIVLDPEVSAHDRLTDAPDLPLTVVRDVFFSLPPGAAELVLSSTDPVLAAAYNRPAGLPRRFHVPEDYHAGEPDAERRQTWFPVRPREWQARLAEGRAPVVVAPQPPPEDDPEILAGIYEWEQFFPEGDWLARDLLLPRSSERMPRAEALAVSYVELPPGPPLRLSFASATLGAEVEPQLVYLREEAAPVDLRVRIDGETVLETTLTARRGTLALPRLQGGKHEVTVEASGPVSVLVNQVEDAPTAFLRRRALRIGPGEIAFEIEKRAEEDELLVLHAFPQSGELSRQELRVVVEGVDRDIGPFAGWTLSHREYNLRLGPEAGDIPVLGRDDAFVGPERSMLVPLSQDLPPGNYRLRLHLDAGPDFYLVLSRTVSGVAPRRALVQE